MFRIEPMKFSLCLCADKNRHMYFDLQLVALDDNQLDAMGLTQGAKTKFMFEVDKLRSKKFCVALVCIELFEKKYCVKHVSTVLFL